MSQAARRGRGAGRSRPPARRRSWGRNWLLWAVVGVVVVAGVIAIVISAGDDGGGEIAEAVTVDGGALPALPASGADPAVGEPAPGLAGTSPTGQDVTYRPGGGEPSVMVVLAHWCPHCQAEVPRIVALAERGGTDGVAVYALTTATNSSQGNYPPSTWLEREGWPFPVIADTEDQTAAEAYGLTGYPFLVFVDAGGNVAGRISGEVSEADLAVLFDELRAGEPLSIPSAGGRSPAG